MHRKAEVLSWFFFALLLIFFPFSLLSQDFDPQKALAYEIASANKKELIQMASAVGLSVSGTEEELRNRLYSYYSISAPKGAQIELKSAQKIYSGPVSALNQSVTQLSGGVEIQVTEEAVQHIIRAENITIYQKIQAIYASGNVQYELNQQGSKQIFFSTNMVFNSKKWASLLVNISGKNTLSIQEGSPEMDFYLTAKKIEKNSNGLVLLDGVVVTSCNEGEDPHFRFRFGQLWVLNEKEAVAQNMTLYMGHVPVFYFPFYYHGQDILPFNPVVGYRSPDGIFINTTSYLYGKKPSSDSSGLFNIMSNEEQKNSDDGSGGYLKMMIDYYSMLGVFGGFAGYIPVMNTEFQLGVAYSRTIFDSVSIYPSSGPVEEQINTSTWFGITLPFRYGVDLEGEAENFSWRIQNYSDPYFKQDFFFRQENAGFFGFLASFGGTNQEEEIYQTQSYLRYQNTWNFNYPGLSTFAIDYLNFEMISTIKRNININTTDSPNYYFYIPSTFNLPNIQMRLEGNWSFNPEKKDSNAINQGQNDRSTLPDMPSVLEENNLNLLTVKADDRNYQSSFFYRWQVNERLYYQPYTTPWNRPEDTRVIFDDIRSLSVSRLNFGIETTTNDNYFTFREGLQLDLQYLSRFNEAAAVNPAQETKTDQSNRFFILSNVFDLGYYPLLDVQNWEKTGFEYHMTARIYQNVYNSNSNTRINTPTFLPEKHYVDGQIRYDTGFWWAYFSTKTELPPNVILKSNTQSGVGFAYWGLSGEAYTYVHENISTFNSMGYGFAVSYNPLEKISLYQTTEIDFFSGLNLIDVGIKLYGFSAALRWEDRYLWNFNHTIYTWQTVLRPDGSQAHGFVLSYLDLRLNEDITLFEFWENRGRMKLLLNSQWLIDFVRYDQSSLSFGFGFGFEITDMVSVSLSTSSLNRATYLYFPFMRDKMGITGSYNFFADLWDSFKFWDIQARQRSNFKLENIQASVSFDLHDWILTVIYTGGPKTGAFTVKNLWDNQVSFLIAWKAVPAVMTQANYDPQYGLYLGPQLSSR